MNESIIKSLFQRLVAFHPVIAKATGSVKLTLIWDQINYWKEKTNDPDGWVYKSVEDLFNELGLSRYEIENARGIGLKLGVLECKLKGMPATMHYRVNEDRMIEVIGKYLETKPDKKVNITKETKTENSIEYVRKIPATDIEEIMNKYCVSPKTILQNAEAVENYCKAHGKRYSNYKAALINFIKSDIEKHPDKKIQITKQIINKVIDPRENRTKEEQEKINKSLGVLKESISNNFKIK